MQVEITNATFGTSGTALRHGTAVARVTINGETRELPAVFNSEHYGETTWRVAAGVAVKYPKGDKVHNVGMWVFVGATETTYTIIAGRATMRSRLPRCVGFFNDCANAAARTFRA